MASCFCTGACRDGRGCSITGRRFDSSTRTAADVIAMAKEIARHYPSEERMPAASNTRECFSEFIGHRVIGVLFGEFPAGRPDLQGGSKTLVFEDGRGLTISNKGTFWIDSADEVTRAVARTRDRLEATQRELSCVLQLAGASPSSQPATSTEEGDHAR